MHRSKARVGGIDIAYIDQGMSDDVVLAIHGNLGCAEWLSLVLPLLPPALRVIASDCRGCGESDRPEAAADYANYTMATHANDMIGVLDALGIGRCHLFGHSSGAIVCSHMLVQQPERFRRVLMLDPVTPLGLALVPEQTKALSGMKRDPEVAFAGLATAAPTLFRHETLVEARPQFAHATSALQREAFGMLVDRMRGIADGVWFGTPHDLAREWETGALAASMPAMLHEHLVLYGKLDYWIPRAHVEEMAARLPNCRLELFPFVGHSMNLEVPALFARIFSDYFRDA
jgi:pimeloyl-ACP methyl ester carboxylesterase